MNLLGEAIPQIHHIPASGWFPTTLLLRLRFGYYPLPSPYPDPASPCPLGPHLPPDFPGSRVWWNPGPLPWLLLHVALGRGGEAVRLGQAAGVQVYQMKYLLDHILNIF